MVTAANTRIYLMRHGEVVLAETRRFIGHLDAPLSELGERQCRAQADRLRTVTITALYASDLSRARRSAELVGEPHRLTPTVLPTLREMAMGTWDGLTAAEIKARDPLAFEEWMKRVGEFPFPGGESVPDLAARAWPAFEKIVAAHPGEAIAVVAHGGTNRALLCRVLGVPFERLLAFGQDYAALSVLEYSESGWRLHRLNERPVL